MNIVGSAIGTKHGLETDSKASLLTSTFESTLWPLFHYLPGELNFDETFWGIFNKQRSFLWPLNCSSILYTVSDAYVFANGQFADAVHAIAEEGDLIWIQDYHLMLLPAYLRERLLNDNVNVKIGFFLHTPFPSSEIYR
jgi:trehalose-6-phosphate synthase